MKKVGLGLDRVENGIIYILVLLCAAGSAGLWWTFGVFITPPWRDGRLLSLAANESQIIAASSLFGLATAWGSLHILSIADHSRYPKIHTIIRVILVILWMIAFIRGTQWASGLST